MANPNIVLLTNDQHRWDFFSGGAVNALHAPHLQRLRREGTTSENMYSTCPLCVPTRLSWLYGLRASQANGAWGELDTQWPSHLRSMAHVLQDAGYYTSVVGKMHTHSGLRRLDLGQLKDQIHQRGFDHVVEMSGKSLVKWFDCTYTRHLEERGLLNTYRETLERLGGDHAQVLPFDPSDAMDAVIGDHACEWLKSYQGKKPFFFHVSFCNPHSPYDPPEPYASRHRPEDMPVPYGLDDPEAIRKYQAVRALYCGLIEHCDEQIGRILDLLDQLDLTENTVIVFGSDHGDLLGDRHLLGKHQPYEASARTPLTIRFPGAVAAGQSLKAPCESIDLPATLLEAAGCRGAAGHWLPSSPGRSLWSLATGRGAPPRDWAYSEMGPWKMVCDGEWKFIHRRDGPDELYHLPADPGECHNLAADRAQDERVRRMQRWIITSLSENIAPPSQHLAGVPAAPPT